MTRQFIIVLVSGLAFNAAVAAHLGGVNGPWYWQWPWRELSLSRVALFLLPPFVVLLWVMAKMEEKLPVRRIPALLVALVAAHFSLQVLAMALESRGWGLAADIVKSPSATSYYSDALKIAGVREWLGSFHTLRLNLHSSTHPPGPVLFYHLWIVVFGAEAGAWVGAALIAAAASLGPAVAYEFVGLWSVDYRAKLTGGILYAVMPASILFFPEFDQIYPLLSMAIVILWRGALTGKKRAGAFLGGALFVAIFFAYNFLVLGAFLLLYTGYVVSVASHTQAMFRSLRITGAIAMGTFLGLFVLLQWTTGYQPFQSFVHALETQSRLSQHYDRPYFPCIAFDLYDFLLGAGIVAAPMVFLYLEDTLERFRWGRADLVLAYGGLLAILLVDLSGILRAETARVWLFLQPLLLISMIQAMRSATVRMRFLVIAMQWCTLVCLKSRMLFLQP